MDKIGLHQKLAETIVAKLRDENYTDFLKLSKDARSITWSEYENIPKNPNVDPILQNLQDERVRFLNSLTEEQVAALNKLVLNTLDHTAFNFLREIEGNLGSNNGLSLTVDSEKVENIHDEFLSGTLFGEYFLWVERNSKHGPFQH